MTTESCHPEEQLQATIAEHPRRGKGHVLSMDPVGGGQAPSPTVFLLLEPDPSAMKPPQDDKVCCHPEEQLQATRDLGFRAFQNQVQDPSLRSG